MTMGRAEEKKTICWTCANACGGCSWSDHWKHRPVPGWKAEKALLRVNRGEMVESYSVIECPEYRPDGERK